jgi:hypothetical protein
MTDLGSAHGAVLALLRLPAADHPGELAAHLPGGTAAAAGAVTRAVSNENGRAGTSGRGGESSRGSEAFLVSWAGRFLSVGGWGLGSPAA